MNKSEYEKEKEEIFLKAKKRTEKILNKYKDFDCTGMLDGEPWAKELHEDSKRILQELKELDDKYNK